MTFPRVRRSIHVIAVGLSLVLLVTIIALSIREQSRSAAPFGFLHRSYVPGRIRVIHLTAHGGGVWFDWAYHDFPSPAGARMMREQPRWWSRFYPPGSYGDDSMFLGFYFESGRLATRTTFCLVRVPYWFVVLASAVLPTRALAGRLRLRRRRRRGLCLQCGYDLRGSSDRCPECGSTIGHRPEHERSPATSDATGSR